jgi:N-acetylmuramoyl-L-alanine amidase
MIAICIGHSRQGDRSGAVSIGGVREWDYNRSVARHMMDHLASNGVAAKIYNDYPRKGYGAAMAWLGARLREDKASAAIELHFNASSNAAANGHEWIHFPGSRRGQALAQCFEDQFNADFPGINERGLLARGKGNGAAFLKLTPCPAIITEPFFGSNPNDWRAFDGKQRELGICYAKAVMRWIK